MPGNDDRDRQRSEYHGPAGAEDTRDAGQVVSSEEVVEGEVDVTIAGRRAVRVLVPAGVGVPGFDDSEVAGAVVAELLERGEQLPDVIDVSRVLTSEPGFGGAVQARLLAPG